MRGCLSGTNCGWLLATGRLRIVYGELSLRLAVQLRNAGKQTMCRSMQDVRKLGFQ